MPMARAASPFLLILYPSIMDAAVVEAPGMPVRRDVIDRDPGMSLRLEK